VRLAHELRHRLPREFNRRGHAWELSAAAPDVVRFEYQLELVDRKGRTERVVDPANPKSASGPWGDKSVWEAPDYKRPAWLEHAPLGDVERTVIPSRVLRASLPALLWSHPEAHERSPVLVVHDGPEYAQHSSLLTLLGQLPPLRAVLIGPVDRDEVYSASARYARALADEILPSLGDHSVRIGMGASLGALAMLHTHRRHAASFDALFLQSGSFFRRRDRHEQWFPRYERISRFVGATLAGSAERPIPVTILCGSVEENLPSNEAMYEALRRQRYDARFHEFRDGHNWVAWRDSFHPHLLRLLQRV
jgi:enterochelin esterase-like enzyme